MRFVPATNHEDALRHHEPVFGGRGESHALGTKIRPDDAVVLDEVGVAGQTR